jgi:hypothetical protein
MMVSIATAVFPVSRSPMISSRWPIERQHRINDEETSIKRSVNEIAIDDRRAGRSTASTLAARSPTPSIATLGGSRCG